MPIIMCCGTHWDERLRGDLERDSRSPSPGDDPMTPRWLALLVCLCLVPVTHAATFTVSSCDETAVDNCVNQTNGNDNCTGLQDNDTVIIPAGTCEWTYRLFLPQRPLTLSGVGSTTILKDMSNPKVDNLINFSGSPGGVTRLTNFVIDGRDTPGGNSAYGLIGVSNATIGAWRIDHLHIFTGHSPAVTTWGSQGVIDNNTIEMGVGAPGPGVYGFNGGVYPTDGYGDTSWATDSEFGSAGTSTVYYVEDNTFVVPSGAPWIWAHDGWIGERVVFRFNTVVGASINNHGTESSGRWRGGRSVEIYANAISYGNGATGAPDGVIGLRSGTGYIWQNTITGTTVGGNPTHFGTFTSPRQNGYDNAYSMWKGCVPSSGWDDPEATVYDSGTHNGGNGVQDVLTDTTKNWTPDNTWVGYTLVNTDVPNAGGIVIASTATTITTTTSLEGTHANTWDSGDNYQIRKMRSCLDQSARGKGDVISGDPPNQVNVTLGNIVAWPRQAREPIYAWGNTFFGAPAAFASGSPSITVANVDYFNGTAGFDGTSGIGSGTLASRPATCTTGVGYWATDQGSWNAGTNSNYTGQGVLYTCTSTNTWTLSYTPYPYPHPLRGEFLSPTTTVPPHLGGFLLGR